MQKQTVILILSLAFLMPLLGGCAGLVTGVGGGSSASQPPLSERDARIVNRINSALVRASDIQATGIRVRSRDGRVTLSGSVPYRRTEARVLELVRQVPEVRAVVSRLVIAN